jgi:hypothetical protein
MEIDGHTYIHGVERIEIEKVQGEYSQFVRIKIRGVGNEATDNLLSFACWASATDMTSPAPEVIITDKDETAKMDAARFDSEESDR